MQERHDIATRADIELLVDRFYETAMVDPLIGFLFTDVAHLDLEKHRPTITAFWETLLLGAGTYGGGAFAVHARLHEKVPLQAGHFTRWVVLWENTVNELFAGEVADAAINHGRRIATAFFRRLQDPTYGFAADELPVLPITQVPGAAL
ncbi:MAG: group III truncated hemoglobin [Baekduia sp.]